MVCNTSQKGEGLTGSLTKLPSSKKQSVRKEGFQVWTLQVNLEQSTAKLTCDNGNGRIVYQKEIGHTDFPLAEIKIYVANNVILLPSEY